MSEYAQLIEPTRIAVFASNDGSSFENVVQTIRDNPEKTVGMQVVLLVCNNSDANVIKRAKRLSIPVHISDQSEPWINDLRILQDFKINLILSLGYTKLIRREIVDGYRGKIINMHPAPLPEFGGKGMYGLHVHKKVLESGVQQTNCTMHFVNEKYDDGSTIITGVPVMIKKDMTPEILQREVLKTEHKLMSDFLKEFRDYWNREWSLERRNIVKISTASDQLISGKIIDRWIEKLDY